MTRRLALLLLASLILSACAPMGDRGGPGGNPPSQGGEMGGGGSSMIVAQLQSQLQATAEALKLTPKQNALWDAYQEKISALMSDQMKLMPYQASGQNALLQIGRKTDTVRNRLTAMEDIQDAAGKLYAALDDKQKKVADQMLPQTVPALYSGFGSSSGGSGGERGSERAGGGRGGPGGSGGMGGPGGGMGGGFGRM